MKKVFLVIAIALFSLNTFAQQKINVDDLIGYWKPDEESSQLFFWKDIDGNLQVQEICGSTGEPVDLIRLKVNEDNLIIDTIFKPNQWVVRSVFTITNVNELTCSITGDAEGTIHYTKIK
jgi:hypothetical protein